GAIVPVIGAERLPETVAEVKPTSHPVVLMNEAIAAERGCAGMSKLVCSAARCWACEIAGKKRFADPSIVEVTRRQATCRLARIRPAPLTRPRPPPYAIRPIGNPLQTGHEGRLAAAMIRPVNT